MIVCAIALLRDKLPVIGSVVEGETRVVRVQVELNNLNRQLKLEVFAQLEVLTKQTPTAILAIPRNAIVEAKGKQLVYVQNGNAYPCI